MNAMGQPIIILNSLKSVADIMEKKASAAAGRPTTVFAGEMYDLSVWGMVFTN